MRQVTKERRTDIRRVTDELNGVKEQIDRLKARLDRKEQERRQRLQQEQVRQQDEFGDDAEEIIDEEELIMLRELKDLKKEYRDLFGNLKTYKEDHHDAQQQIDIYKDKLLVQFEQWYQEEFESAAYAQEQTVQMGQEHTLGATGMDFSGNNFAQAADDEQNVFRRAKRNVDTLHRARKMEKAIR